MKGKEFVVLCLAFIVTLVACQEDEEVLFDEPKVKLTFFNLDSLASVIDTLKWGNDSIRVVDSVLTYHSDSANVLLDSTFVLEGLIAGGQTELQPVLDDLSSQLLFQQGEYGATAVIDSIMTAFKSKWDKVAITLNSGSVAVSSIQNKKNGLSIAYDEDDSATVWQLPLSMTKDDVFVAITIDGQAYDLKVNYKRSTIVDDHDNIVIEASELEAFTDPLNDGFDSLEMKCITPECIDSETTINIYF